MKMLPRERIYRFGRARATRASLKAIYDRLCEENLWPVECQIGRQQIEDTADFAQLTDYKVDQVTMGVSHEGTRLDILLMPYRSGLILSDVRDTRMLGLAEQVAGLMRPMCRDPWNKARILIGLAIIVASYVPMFIAFDPNNLARVVWLSCFAGLGGFVLGWRYAFSPLARLKIIRDRRFDAFFRRNRDLFEKAVIAIVTAVVTAVVARTDSIASGLRWLWHVLVG